MNTNTNSISAPTWRQRLTAWLGIKQSIASGEREGHELTERWDIPSGEDVPHDLRNTKPQYFLTRDGSPVSARLSPNDLAEGSQSPAVSLLFAGLPICVALAMLLQGSLLLSLVPVLIAVAILVAIYQSTETWFWALIAGALGVAVPTAGGAGAASMLGPFGLPVLGGVALFVIIVAGLTAENWKTGVKTSLGVIAALGVASAVSMVLPPWLSQLAWLGFGCVLPVIYIRSLERARALDLVAATHRANIEAYAGLGRAHIPAREQQANNARRDTSAFFTFGRSTGHGERLRDPFAPAAGQTVGITARDMSTHVLVIGSTGTGKTSCAIRPNIRRWMETKSGGVVVMDGKGGMAGEFRNTPEYVLVEPGQADVSLFEGLTPLDATMSLLPSAIKDGNDKHQFFTSSGREMLLHGLILLDALVRVESAKVESDTDRSWHWTLHDAQALLARMQRANPEQSEKADEILSYVKREPEFGKGGILDDAVAYWEQTIVGMDAETKSNIWATVGSWISPILGDERLLPWAKLEHGADVTVALRGGAVGVCLPSFIYGAAGQAVQRLIKQRIFTALRRRADRDGVAGRKHWSEDGETPVLMAIDEAQELVGQADLEMLPVARSLGCAALYATQNLDSFTVRFGQAAALQFVDAFRSVVSFASSEATLKWVQARLGKIRALVFPAGANMIGYGETLVRAAGSPIYDDKHPGAALFRRLRRKGAGAIRTARDGSNLALGGHASWRGIEADSGDLLINAVDRGQWQTRNVVEDEDIGAATSRPFTAIVQVMRGGVIRRDIIEMTPDFGVIKPNSTEEENNNG